MSVMMVFEDGPLALFGPIEGHGNWPPPSRIFVGLDYPNVMTVLPDDPDDPLNGLEELGRGVVYHQVMLRPEEPEPGQIGVIYQWEADILGDQDLEVGVCPCCEAKENAKHRREGRH